MSDRILITTADQDGATAPRRRGPWRATSLVAILALLIAGWSFASTSTPEDSKPDPTLVPQPFSPPDGTWSEIEFSGDGAFISVLDTGEGLIAAGSGRRVDATPFVWTSADGATWNQASGDWEPGDLITTLVKGPAGYLAGGYQIDQSFRGTVTDAEPKIWSSPDGTSWVQRPIAGLPDGGVITGMAAAAEAVIAIGWNGPAVLEPLSAPIPEATPRVWSSEDGINWTDITPDGAATWFAAVAVTPTGFALGGANARGAAIWTFEQGTWTHLPAPEPDDDTVTALTWRDDRLVALTRSASDPEALVFVWSVIEGAWDAALTGIERPGMGGWIATIDGNLFAASAFTRTVISNGPELYVSQSGTEWIGVEVTAGVTPWPPPRIMSILEFENDLYAFGSRGPSPAAWRLLDEPTPAAG